MHVLSVRRGWQPFEAHAFATYMAGSTLFVDVWDADALMHIGTLAMPLRELMRQQKGVVKTAMVSKTIRESSSNELREYHICWNIDDRHGP